MKENRDLLQENITGISIPKTGRALLETNPAGLFKTAGVLLYVDPEGSPRVCNACDGPESNAIVDRTV